MFDSLFEFLDDSQISYELNRRGFQLHASGLFDVENRRYLDDEESECLVESIASCY